MKADDRSAAMQSAVLEWQKKYKISDGDPMLAAVELFQITLGGYGATGSGPRTAVFEEFREALEGLDQRTRVFTKQVTELSQLLRSVAKNVEDGECSSAGAWFLVLALLGAGIAIWRFWV
ncbi:MAG: hypothetical protein WCO60_18585 [Verrucomicrobiota bacterium]